MEYSLVNMNDFDAVVVGSGFAGSTVANKLASAGKKVLVVEQRGHIGGNMYETYIDDAYCRAHLYGPHIFHTDSVQVYDYLSQFTDWMEYYHKVKGRIDGKLVPIPFNFTSLETLFDQRQAKLIEERLLKTFPVVKKVFISQLLECPDPIVSEFGQYVYEKVFVHYTAKQWGVPIEQVDKSVINRVPVRLDYEDNYFGSAYQCMPKDGYNPLFDRMLGSANITVMTKCDFADIADFSDGKTVKIFGQTFTKPVIYSGAVDRLLQYRFGQLPYRTVDMIFENKDVEHYQECAVVNYPNEEKFTRITEFKYMTGEVKKNTTILYEYPVAYTAQSTPYYPINNKENLELYAKYVQFLSKFGNIYLCGRLAEYKYYDMDKCVERALNLSQQLFK